MEEPEEAHISPISTYSENAQHIAQLFGSGRMADITFVIGKEEFKAHKLILCAISSVFAGMFEKNNKLNDLDRLKIELCEPKIFQALLRFIYTVQIEETEVAEIMKLSVLAIRYKIELLKHKCDFLSNHLSHENCCSILMLADEHDVSVQKKNVLGFIREHSSFVIKSDGWKDIRESRPQLAVFIFEFVRWLVVCSAKTK